MDLKIRCYSSLITYKAEMDFDILELTGTQLTQILQWECFKTMKRDKPTPLLSICKYVIDHDARKRATTKEKTPYLI